VHAQQPITISGSVMNQNGEPLQGATVIQTATTNTTVTDQQGLFKLLISSQKGTLEISYIGYITAVIPLKNQSTIHIVLKEATSNFDEVVVIGYGTQKRSDLTGAVGSVSEEKLKQRPAASLNQMLACKIAGVKVNTNSGRPGGKNNVRVRGFSSINSSNNPLYVVDGVILPMSDQLLSGASNPSQAIDYLNPNDIASVEVLKDASVTAIYGARGANGVILITTKRGKPGESGVTYDGEYSVPILGPNFPKFLNAKEFLAVEDLAYKNMEKYDPAGWAAGKFVSRNPQP